MAVSAATGRCVVATQDIKEGEVVVEVPDDAVLMGENCEIQELLAGGVLQGGSLGFRSRGVGFDELFGMCVGLCTAALHVMYNGTPNPDSHSMRLNPNYATCIPQDPSKGW
jgi:hypothetical protein